MQAAERDVRACAAVVVGDAVGAVRRRDVDLNHHEVRRVVQIERLDVLVLNLDLIVVGLRYAGERAPGRAAETAST